MKRKIVVSFLAVLLAFLVFSPVALAAAEYQVKKGDTPYGIWKKNGLNKKMSLERFMEINRIKNPRRLQIGKILIIPESSTSQKEAEAPILTKSKVPLEVIPVVEKAKQEKSPANDLRNPQKNNDTTEITTKGVDQGLAFDLAWNGAAPVHEFLDARGSASWSRGESDKANRKLTSRYLDLGFYPLMLSNEGERFYFGGGWRYQDWWGESASRSSFEGERSLGYFGAKYYTENFDLSAKLFIGHQETYAKNSQGTWEGWQEMDLFGPGISGGYYARKNSGEAWFSEVTFWASYLFAFDQYSESSYKGKALPESSYANEVLGVWSAGARVYVYDAYRDLSELPIRSFAEISGFGDIPFSPSFVATVGITDKWEILEASVGWRFTDGEMSVWSIGINADRAVSQVIKIARQGQVGPVGETSFFVEDRVVMFNAPPSLEAQAEAQGDNNMDNDWINERPSSTWIRTK